MKNKSILIYLTFIGLLLAISIGWYVFAFLTQTIDTAQDRLETTSPPTDTQPPSAATRTANIHPAYQPSKPTQTLIPVSFDGDRAFQDVVTQVTFGSRIPGSEGHAKVQAWIRDELVAAGWQVEIQESEAMGHPIQNIVAKRGGEVPQIVIGAHYDSRMFADNDPDPANRSLPVPAANDGASGVAVLLELGRVLPDDTVPIWLVFFDAEDNGRIDTWDWILGSTEFVKNNPIQPQAVVVIDMIGDADLNIYKEKNSNNNLTNEIWAVANGLGYDDVFIPDYGHSMIDDHIPFLRAGIPAIDIIDFDYPYWHTTQDTPDKVSAQSLQAVGETLLTWIIEHIQP